MYSPITREDDTFVAWLADAPEAQDGFLFSF